MSATALIISGIIAAASALTSSALQNKSMREAKEESKDLAMIARGDTLKKQSDDFGLSKAGQKLDKEKLGLDKMKTSFEMAQTRKASNSVRLSNLSTALSNSSVKDQNMTNFLLSLYGKTGGI